MPWLAPGQNIQASTYIREEVKALFDKNVKNVWIVLSSGKLDHTHVVDMAFGTDGHTLKGFYFLRSSGEKFEIEGDENNGVFKLVESDKRGRTTGFIIGNFNGQHFSGKWVDAEKRRTLALETQVLESFEEYQPVLCDQRTWHSFFEGKIENISHVLHVHKQESTLQIHGKKGDTTLVDTTIILNSKQTLVFSLTSKLKAIIDLTSPEYIVVEDVESKQNFLLYRLAYAPFECFEFANFSTRIETMRPVIANKKFNHWLDHEFKKWHELSHKKFNSQVDESLSNSERYKDVGYGWVELSYLSDAYISGHVFTQSSWKKGTDKKSFIFDLKNSKNMEGNLLLKEALLENISVDSLINLQKQNLSFKDEKVKSWVSNQSFQHVTLHVKGVCFQTNFSNVYGEHKIIIPYPQLKPLCKNKSLLKNF